jgi:hypothetical protein
MYSQRKPVTLGVVRSRGGASDRTTGLISMMMIFLQQQEQQVHKDDVWL